MKKDIADAMESDPSFIGRARACSWYANTCETANHLITNSTLAIPTFGGSVGLGLLLKALFKRKTYEKKKETTKLFIHRFIRKDPENMAEPNKNCPEDNGPKLTNKSYFSARTLDQINAVFDYEPEFVPDNKFFYQFKKDQFYYVWQALAQLTGWQWLKPRIEQYHDSIDNAHKILHVTQEVIQEVIQTKLTGVQGKLKLGQKIYRSVSDRKTNSQLNTNLNDINNITEHTSLLDKANLDIVLKNGRNNKSNKERL